MTNYCIFCEHVSDEDNPVEKLKVRNGFLYVCRKDMLVLRDEIDNRLKALDEVAILRTLAI